MTRDEFRDWVSDLQRRLPDTGHYVATLPKETRDCWYDDVFANVDLRDGTAANQRLMQTGVKAFDRERLPAHHCSARAKRSHTKGASVRESGASNGNVANAVWVMDDAESFDPLMRRCFIALGDHQQQQREQHDTPITNDQRREFVHAYFESHDTSDPTNEPRYTCLDCLDSGLVSFALDDRRTVGYCRCARGDQTGERFNRVLDSGLGPALLRESAFDSFNSR